MALTKDEYRQAIRQGAPIDAPFDLPQESKDDVLLELGLLAGPKAAVLLRKRSEAIKKETP